MTPRGHIKVTMIFLIVFGGGLFHQSAKNRPTTAFTVEGPGATASAVVVVAAQGWICTDNLPVLFNVIKNMDL